jgi:hypothetical protein
MDPQGALKLYQNAANTPQREMLDGVGHGENFRPPGLHCRLFYEATRRRMSRSLFLQRLGGRGREFPQLDVTLEDAIKVRQ